MTVILVRHGRSTANTASVLAGRSPGVHLDNTGRRQAEALVTRLTQVRLHAIVCSPLQRCLETMESLTRAHNLAPVVTDDLIEVDYGSWTGRGLLELAGEDLWKIVQVQPSAAHFPNGESLRDVQYRAVRSIRQFDAQFADEAGHDVPWIACSHGDVIKTVLADAYGMHLDCFQRIIVNPASVSVVRYTATRPYVECVNNTGVMAQTPESPTLEARPGRNDRFEDAVVGGGPGS